MCTPGRFLLPKMLGEEKVFGSVTANESKIFRQMVGELQRFYDMHRFLDTFSTEKRTGLWILEREMLSYNM